MVVYAQQIAVNLALLRATKNKSKLDSCENGVSAYINPTAGLCSWPRSGRDWAVGSVERPAGGSSSSTPVPTTYLHDQDTLLPETLVDRQHPAPDSVLHT